MAHQAKRPYAGSQPPITSYFPLTSSPPNGQYNISNSQATSANDQSFPSLPVNVQSNLISVGMRVRKSVPEGYKTGNYSAFNLFNENTAAPPQVATEKTPLKTRPRAGARELTPFCGILKVGGMAQQQWGIWNPTASNQAHDGSIYVEEEMEEDEEAPFLSSQGSTISTASVSTPTRENKRRFFEEDDEDENEKKSFTNRELGERVLAVPRRKKLVGKGAAGGQENLSFVGRDVDFEDAEFLDYGLVGEVEMSG